MNIYCCYYRPTAECSVQQPNLCLPASTSAATVSAWLCQTQTNSALPRKIWKAPSLNYLWDKWKPASSRSATLLSQNRSSLPGQWVNHSLHILFSSVPAGRNLSDSRTKAHCAAWCASLYTLMYSDLSWYLFKRNTKAGTVLSDAHCCFYSKSPANWENIKETPHHSRKMSLFIDFCCLEMNASVKFIYKAHCKQPLLTQVVYKCATLKVKNKNLTWEME